MLRRTRPIRFVNWDLDAACSTCQGEGSVPNPAYQAWEEAHPDADETERPSLEELPDALLCDDCEGQGYVLTEAGGALVRFMRRYSC